MVRSHEHFARELVERRCEAFSDAPAVDEDQCGPMRLYELQQTWMNRCPDRRARRGRRRRTTGNLVGLPHPGHVLDRDLDPQVEPLFRRRIYDGDRPILDWLMFGGSEFVVDCF